MLIPQSRQSAKLFSSRRNWDSPNPSPAGECAPPPPLGSGGRCTFAGERGGERVPILIKGRTLWYPLYICTNCMVNMVNTNWSPRRPLWAGRGRARVRGRTQPGTADSVLPASRSDLIQQQANQSNELCLCDTEKTSCLKVKAWPIPNERHQKCTPNPA